MACALKTGRNKRLLDKYTNIVGNESAAYSILYYNNWNDLSKTPNGQDSVLYRKLLSRFDGDEVKASKYKSYCYSPAFFDMFGNWTTGDRSKLVEPGLVDENGEPSTFILFNDEDEELFDFEKGNWDERGILEDQQKSDDKYNQDRSKYIEDAEKLSTLKGEEFGDKERNEAELRYITSKYQQVTDGLNAVFKDGLSFNPVEIDGKLYYQGMYGNQVIRISIDPNNNGKSFSAVSINEKINDVDSTITLLQMGLGFENTEAMSKEILSRIVHQFEQSPFMHEAIDFYMHTKGITQAQAISKLVDDTYNKMDSKNEKPIKFLQFIKHALQNIFKSKKKKSLIRLSNILSNALRVGDNLKLIDVSNFTIKSLNQAEQKRFKSKYNGQAGVYDDEKEFQKRIEQYKTQLLNMLNTQLSRYKNAATPNAMVEAELSTLITKLNAIDNIKAIKTFVEENTNSMIGIINALNKSRQSNYANINVESLNSLRVNFIQMYSNFVDEIQHSIRKDFQFNNKYIANQFNKNDMRNIREFTEKLDSLKLCYYDAVEKVNDRIIDNFVENSPNIANKEAARSALKQAARVTGKDILWTEEMLYTGDKSSNAIIRMIDDLNATTETQIQRDIVPACKKILKALKELGKSYNISNVQRQLMEVDDEGNTTGNYLSKINRGQYEKEYRNFIKNYIDKLSYKDQLETDDFGNYVFPEGMSNEESDFLDAVEDFEDKHANKRYTKEYYKNRRKILTLNARKQLSDIQKRIYILTAPYIQDGEFIRFDLMNHKEKKMYDQLLDESKQLENEYDSFGEHKSIQQVSDAKSITAWKVFLKNKVQYKANTEKFNAIRQSLKNNLEALKAFDDNYTKRSVNPEYWDLVSSILGSKQKKSNEISMLIKQRSLLIQQVREDSVDGSILDISKCLAHPNILLRIRDIDQQISDMRKSDKKTAEDIYSFSNFFEKEDATTPNGDWAFEQLKNDFEQRQQETVQQGIEYNSIKDFTQIAYYVSKHGKPVRTSVFYKFVPMEGMTLREFVENGYTVPQQLLDKYGMDKEIPAYEDSTPNEKFQSLDKDSEYANKDFDDTDKHFIQPKKSMYENKQFSKLDKNSKDYDEKLRNLYDTCIELNDLAYSNYGLTRFNEHQLPQIFGKMSQIVTTNLFGGSFFKRIAQNIKYVIITEFNANSNDDDLQFMLREHAFENYQSSIPRRFIQKMSLDDSKYISSDIVNSSIRMAISSMQYKYKKQIEGLVNSFLAQQEDNSNGGRNERAVSKLRDIIQQGIYGKFSRFGKKELAGNLYNKKTLNFVKRASKVRKFTSNYQLAFKGPSMGTGFLDSMITNMVNAITAKYINKRDGLFASKEMYNLLNGNGLLLLKDFHNPQPTSKVGMLMQMNNLVISLVERYEGLNKSRARRIINDFFGGYTGYTLGDYTNTSWFMISTYHNFKFVDEEIAAQSNGLLKPGFYSEDAIRNIFDKNGDGYSKGQKLYNKCKVSLWDVYKVNKNKELEVQEEYKKYVTTGLMDLVSTRCQQRASISNGMLSDTSSNMVTANPITKFLTQMRSYITLDLGDRLNCGNDFALKPNSFDNLDEYGLYNWQTGTVENGVISTLGITFMKLASKVMLQFLPGVSSKVSKFTNSEFNLQEKQAMKQCLAETAAIGIQYLITLMFRKAHLRNPDDWFLSMASFLSIRVFSSRLEKWDPSELLSIITTISTSISVANQLKYPFQTMGDILGMTGHNVTDYVENGNYGGMQRWQRGMLVMFPMLNNTYRSTNINSLNTTQNYYYNNLASSKLFGSTTVSNNNNEPSDLNAIFSGIGMPTTNDEGYSDLEDN